MPARANTRKYGKKELVERVASKTNLQRDVVGKVADAMLGEMQGWLGEGHGVVLTGFGTFEVRKRAGRTGTHPGTKEKIDIPESNTVVFKPGKELRDTVRA